MPAYINKFPIPTFISPDIEKEIVNYVDKIVDSKNNNTNRDCSLYEKNINQIVYSLYDLTDDEIRLIESIID